MTYIPGSIKLYKVDWTNADVVALGAVATGNVTKSLSTPIPDTEVVVAAAVRCGQVSGPYSQLQVTPSLDRPGALGLSGSLTQAVAPTNPASLSRFANAFTTSGGAGFVEGADGVNIGLAAIGGTLDDCTGCDGSVWIWTDSLVP